MTIIETRPQDNATLETSHGTGVEPMLTIVIPALNEEESISSTVRRCLDSRKNIVQKGRVRGVEIIVVNDGSTDRTGEIADEIAKSEEGVRVIHFAKNRGYGAALKEGFRVGQGELVAFLDADGTCDPEFFAPMCRLHDETPVDIVLGSRMAAGNEMPRIRKIGNRLFALLLGVISGQAITDTASGMRVIRRSALSRLYPLPDGLHFTPAMSARAALDGMTVREIDMKYAERVGESKLHAVRDGFRFLAAILSALLLFRPARVFIAAGALTFATAVLWGVYPLEFYVTHRRLEEGMIFRLLFCSLLLTCTFVFVAAAVLAEDILSLVHRRSVRNFFSVVLDRLLSHKMLLGIALVSTVAACAIVWPGLIEWARTRQTEMHWSRAMLAVLLLQIGVCSTVTAVLRIVVGLWRTESQSQRR